MQLTEPVVLRLLLGLLASLLTINPVVSKHDELLFYVGDAKGHNEEVVGYNSRAMTRQEAAKRRKERSKTYVGAM